MPRVRRAGRFRNFLRRSFSRGDVAEYVELNPGDKSTGSPRACEVCHDHGR